MDSPVHRGSCFCGNVSYSVSGSPTLSAYCHCTLCQRLNSAAFIHTLHFATSVFKWTHSEPHDGLLDSFSVTTRPWKTRWRCKNCGCTVASHNSKADKWSVWGGQLERDSDGKMKGWDVLQPTAHIFYETRMLDVGDSLGKWTGYEGCTSLPTFQMTPSETMSKFRASPWVTYDPSTSTSQSQSQNHPSDDEMDEDVDMDAPQISTLRDEDSPPPPPPPPPSQSPKKAASTRKTKPLPKSKKTNDWAQIRNSVVERKSPGSDDEPDEPEEEEDQLIDDDDDDIPKPSPVPTPSSARSTTADPSQKKKAAVKRKPRKSEKRPVDAAEKKTREKIPQPSGAHLVAPTMSWFEANPTEPHDGVVEPEAPVSVEGPLKIKLSVPGKKKTSPRKPPAIPRAKTKALKQKTAIPPLLIEDAGMLSEGYTGTAASSPVTAQFEANSPEPEPENSRPQSPQAHPSTGAPLLEETNLEGVPIPQYPPPTKPFPVQPAPKMTSGFAPALPLDRSGKKVRRWRTANREIRGIAGGRWFTRTWVGEKESEYAAALLLKAGEEKSTSSGGGLALPKLSNISISAPKAVSKLKASSSKTASLATSAAPSRSGSSIPEGVTSAVRAPTKMRILHVASEAGDSDMAPPPDS